MGGMGASHPLGKTLLAIPYLCWDTFDFFIVMHSTVLSDFSNCNMPAIYFQLLPYLIQIVSMPTLCNNGAVFDNRMVLE